MTPREIRLGTNGVAILRYVTQQTDALANGQRQGSPTTSAIASRLDIGLAKAADWCHRLELAGLIDMGQQGIGWLVTEDGREELARRGGAS